MADEYRDWQLSENLAHDSTQRSGDGKMWMQLTPRLRRRQGRGACVRPMNEAVGQTAVVDPVTSAPHRCEQLRDQRRIHGVIHHYEAVFLVVRPLRARREQPARTS